jgi:hypothetical protein
LHLNEIRLQKLIQNWANPLRIGSWQQLAGSFRPLPFPASDTGAGVSVDGKGRRVEALFGFSKDKRTRLRETGGLE